MGYRFEFDPANKILLARFEGRLTDKSYTESNSQVRKYSIATDPHVLIVDLSSADEFALSEAFIRQLADLESAMPDGARHPLFGIVPTTFPLSIARVFEIAGATTRPLLKIVYTVDEALAALGVQSPHFEPLE
ncbi:MAG: hypothetical protein ABSA27_20010 [Terriglobales bacterium]|jgi:hypothetical protein